MFLADIDAAGYAVIISAAVVGLSSLIGTVASAIVFVRQRTMAANVQKIELATNSMKDALVAKAEAEGMARGGMEERGRADARKVVDDKATLDKSTVETLDRVDVNVKDIKEEVVDKKGG